MRIGDDKLDDEIPGTPMAPQEAHDLIARDLARDGAPARNLGSFVTTRMDEWADDLITRARGRNLADKAEYAGTWDIAQRCAAMVAKLWNPPGNAAPIATHTVGSSEAAMLAGLTLLRRWEHAHPGWDPAKPRASTGQPNLVMGSNVQVCWEKFTNYFGVEPRTVPMEPGQYTATPAAVRQRVDSNTIGIICVLGTTFTGEYEDIAGINNELLALKHAHGLDVPIHVDAASGGFVAPFLQPDLAWDFRLEQVHSINASGHKFGMVYAGVGWVAWRSRWCNGPVSVRNGREGGHPSR